MSFGEPDLLWLCALAPLVALVAGRLWRRRLGALAAWAARGLWSRLTGAYQPSAVAVSVTLLSLAVLLTGLALARPRWGTVQQEVERRGVDMVLVLDSSLSMGTQDVRPSRLDAAKALIRRILEELPQNRVALIQAEGTGEVLAPLTVDSHAVDLLLESVEPGSLPDPGTRLGKALDSALSLFPADEGKHRVVILLSDGEDHGEGLEERLEALEERGVVLHSLGIGTLQGGPVPIPGTPSEHKRYRGETVISQLGESALETLARATGGIYLRIGHPGEDLTPLLERIRSMETRAFEAQVLETQEERFQWPLAGAVASLLVSLGLAPFRAAQGGRR